MVHAKNVQVVIMHCLIYVLKISIIAKNILKMENAVNAQMVIHIIVILMLKNV